MIILQEPQWACIGMDDQGEAVIGLIGHTAWTPILPMATILKGITPRVMMYYRKCPDFSVMLQSDIIQDPDIQVLVISQPGHPDTTIVNVYNDPKKKNQSSVMHLCSLVLPDDMLVIITGDWNMHYPM